MSNNWHIWKWSVQLKGSSYEENIFRKFDRKLCHKSLNIKFVFPFVKALHDKPSCPSRNFQSESSRYCFGCNKSFCQVIPITILRNQTFILIPFYPVMIKMLFHCIKLQLYSHLCLWTLPYFMSTHTSGDVVPSKHLVSGDRLCWLYLWTETLTSLELYSL